MSIDSIHSFIDLIYVVYAIAGGQAPVNYSDLGHFVKRFSSPGPVAGKLTRIATDSLGRLHAANITICSVLSCGHCVTSTQEIAGFCRICGSVCCRECLGVCDLTGITACKRHYTIKDGLVISTYARKGLWRLKARKIAHQKRQLLDAPK